MKKIDEMELLNKFVDILGIKESWIKASNYTKCTKYTSIDELVNEYGLSASIFDSSICWSFTDEGSTYWGETHSIFSSLFKINERGMLPDGLANCVVGCSGLTYNGIKIEFITNNL